MSLQGYVQGYQALTNLTNFDNTDNIDVSTVTVETQLSLPFINPYAILETDVSRNVVGKNLTDGQLLIGSTGAAPVAAQITGTVNQIMVSNGAGSIQIQTPQDINTNSAPTFDSLLLITGNSSNFIQFQTLTGLGNVTYTNGTGTQINDGTIAGGNYVNIYNDVKTKHMTIDDGAGKLTATNIVDSALTGSLASSTAGGLLQNTTISNSNANGSNNTLSFSGSTLTMASSLTQDIQTTATPSFAGLLGNGILMYTTGTITQSGTTVTGSGTTFTSAMAGGLLIPAKGEATVIQTFSSTTSLTVYKSQTISSASNFTIFYTLGSSGFGVSKYGTMLLRTLGNTSAATTGLTLQLVPTGGGASYNIDIDTYNSPYTQPCNGRLQFTDNNFGADFSYYAKIQGSDTNALQRLFKVSADKTVTTFNNTLDTTTTGAANFIGTVTVANLIDSGLSATTLTATNGSKQLQSVTLAAASNGASLSFSGSTLTVTNQQDISTTASPTFANVTDSGIAVGSLVGTSHLSSKLIALSLGSANGVSVSVTADELFVSTPQDVQTTAAPIFAAETLTNTTNQLVLGTTRTVTITAPTPATSSRTHTIPDVSASANFIMSEGAQTINGVKTFGNQIEMGSQQIHFNDTITDADFIIKSDNTNGLQLYDIARGGQMKIFQGVITASVPFSVTNIVGAKLGEYGDGSDGTVTISINTTLTRDMYYNALTVNSTIVLSTGGYRIFVKGNLSLSGTIANNGSDGTRGNNNVAGTGGAGAPAGTCGGGGSGGNGGISGVGGTNGTSETASIGANGGAGSAGAGGAGTGGTATAPTTNNGGSQVIKALPYCVKCRDMANNTLTGGGGGGGGAGSGGVAAGGGGGGGGVVVVAANTISGSGSITANGGAGKGSNQAWYGGGGGGGGCVILITSTVSPGVTLTAAGGGVDTFFPGTAGSAGTTITITH